MWALTHSLLLGVSVMSLADASIRVASLAAPRGLERALAAAVLAAGAAVLWALLLGLIGLGTSPVALTLAALASMAAARLALPAPPVTFGEELAQWWVRLPFGYRVAAGAVAGVAVAQLVWMWRHPWIGADGLGYHLPDALAWVRDGRPGSQHAVLPLIPVQNYALTYEVLVSWVLGISRGFSALAPLQLAFGVLLALAVAVGLEQLGVPRVVRILAAATATSFPMVVEQFNSVGNDLPAVSWMAATAALCAATPRRPALLAPALLSAGLAIGTKSTTAIPTLTVLVLAAAATRRGGARLPMGPLALAAAAAVAVGGVWYLRNIFQHGSPLWPLVAAPWGTPKPYFLALFDRSFLDAPVMTLTKSWRLYRFEMAGGLVMIGAVLPALLIPSRRVRAAALAAMLLLLLWAAAPYTGVSQRPVLDLLAGSTIRYILPALVACTLVVALAAGLGSWRERAALALLGIATVWSIDYVFLVSPSPFVASSVKLGLAALAGAFGSFVIGRAPRLWRRAPAVLPLGVLAAFAGLAPAAAGFARRHGVVNYVDGPLVRWFAAQPGFSSGTSPVAMAPALNAMLAGDRLTHPLVLALPQEGCPRLLARARAGWMVLTDTPFVQYSAITSAVEACLRSRLSPAQVLPGGRVYRLTAG